MVSRADVVHNSRTLRSLFANSYFHLVKAIANEMILMSRSHLSFTALRAQEYNRLACFEMKSSRRCLRAVTTTAPSLTITAVLGLFFHRRASLEAPLGEEGEESDSMTADS